MSWVDNLQERVKGRTSICKECPYLMPVQKRCELCGCFVVPKSAIPSAKCPDGRW